MPRLIRAALARANLEPDAVATGVDVVGDIAIVRTPGLKAKEKKKLGSALLEEMTNVASVFEQEGPVEGEYRLRKLRHLAGKRRTLTVHRENGCTFKVDVAKCYFSPRLSTERLRVAEECRPGEEVLNMFAGVGPFSIPIAKKGLPVTSCEVNSYACDLHRWNDTANRVDRLVSVTNEDAQTLPKVLKTKFDRILMPHPSMADKFVPAALRLAGKRCVVHYYRHVLGRDEEEAGDTLKKEIEELFPRKSRYIARRVREVGPRWMEMVADVRLPA